MKIAMDDFASHNILLSERYFQRPTTMSGVEQPLDPIVSVDAIVKVTTRPSQWFALALFATVALTALTTRYDEYESEESPVGWALIVLIIVLVVSGFAFIASFVVPDKFNGTKVEGGMVSTALLRGIYPVYYWLFSDTFARLLPWLTVFGCTWLFVRGSSPHYECRKLVGCEQGWKYS